MLCRKLGTGPVEQRKDQEMPPRLSHVLPHSVSETQTVWTTARTATDKIISWKAFTCTHWLVNTHPRRCPSLCIVKSKQSHYVTFKVLVVLRWLRTTSYPPSITGNKVMNFLKGKYLVWFNSDIDHCYKFVQIMKLFTIWMVSCNQEVKGQCFPSSVPEGRLLSSAKWVTQNRIH